MIRKHENIYSWKAGILAFAVHLILFGGMIISINWKAAHPPMALTEVVLWDSVPEKSTPQPAVKKPPIPEVKKEPEPKPEPKPVVEEKPKEQPKVDIALEKKKLEEKQKLEEKLKKEKLLEEKRKKEEAFKKLQEQLRDEALTDKPDEDALKKLQQEALSEANAKAEKQASAATASLVNGYIDKIRAKIRGNVNKTLCGSGNPELVFGIAVLPTGDLANNPKLIKSSGNAVCDEAVERAIMASQPLPLPNEADAKAQFRNLNLKFKPNDE
jgi:colicin import membrane protein